MSFSRSPFGASLHPRPHHAGVARQATHHSRFDRDDRDSRHRALRSAGPGATSWGWNLERIWSRLVSRDPAELGLNSYERRKLRRTKRRKAGLVFGAAAAVFLLLVGETPGSALLGFLLFWLISSLSAPF